MTEVANLPKPTLHRWLTMLEGAELLLRRLPDGRRYELAAARSTLARLRHPLEQSGLDPPAPDPSGRRPGPRRILQPHGASGGEVMYLDRVEAAAPLRVALPEGLPGAGALLGGG